MSDEVKDDRDQIVRRVMKSLARLRAKGDVLHVRDAEGIARIYVALPDDRVGDVVARLRDVGDAANVVLAYPDRFMLLAWELTPAPLRRLGGEPRADAVDIHEDSSMEMLRLWLARCQGKPAELRLIRSSLSQPRELEYQF